MPMPVPMSTMLTLVSNWLVSVFKRRSRNVPTSENPNPATARTRYPTLRMSRAAIGDATTIASIIGVRIRPACVADDWLTTCTNSGRNDSVPNITMPVAMPIAFDARTAGILKRSKGISGSDVCRSMKTNATSSTTLPTRQPTIIGEPHA